MVLKFNISASALQLFEDSPLLFFYNYIKKAKHDTITVQCYGLAGNLVHDFLEMYINGEIWDIEMQFSKMWKEKNLDTLRGMNYKPLKEEQYFKAVKNGIKILDAIPGTKKAEERFEFPLVDTDTIKINLKGFIDLIYVDENGDIIIGDYKTSSNINNFSTQSKMYSLLYYLRYGVVPKKVLYYYIKIDEIEEYSYSLEEIIEFQKYINTTVEKITSFGTNIENYDLGDWDTPFNAHRIKCERIKQQRETTRNINVQIENNRLWFDNTLPKSMISMIREKYSWDVEGCEWSDKYQSGVWDGRKHLWRRDSLPLGLIDDFKKFIIDYNQYFNTRYELEFEDKRNFEVINKEYPNEFCASTKIARDYQLDTKNVALKKKRGILYLGTGLGKTFIASEIIRSLCKRTLFLVNRIELVEQTAEVLEKELGVMIGKMSEGNMDISHQITVASVQTIFAIFKRKDEDAKLLNRYLYNVAVTIYDECQNLNDAGMYGLLNKKLINSEYMLGLTGTPERNSGDTLEMNSLVGFPIVSYSTKWGEDNGWLCPTKTIFIKSEFPKFQADYHERYRIQIVENEIRNTQIVEVVKKFTDKNKKIMLVTKSIAHANILGEKLKSNVITSKTKTKDRKQYMKDFKSNKINILVAGVKIAGAGIDIPSLDCMIICGAHKSIIDSAQTIGRVKRKVPGKKFGYLIDFADSGDFKGATLERVAALRAYGNEVVKIASVEELEIL